MNKEKFKSSLHRLHLTINGEKNMNPHLIGETAALCTSVLWTMSSILLASAGKKIGALSVNTIRVSTAILLICVTHFIIFGTVFPMATRFQWYYLSFSGFLGLALGDFGYLGSLVLIGPRRGVLLASMAPVFSTISAYFILDETLEFQTLIGIFITLLGIIIVVIEREKNSISSIPEEKKILGIFFGLVGSIGQGVGYTISKYGMVSLESIPLNPLSATLIRMISATLIVWIIFIFIKKPSGILKLYTDRKAMMLTMGGAGTGPFLGVWLSMIAVTYTAAGVASTLTSLMPILVIPSVWILYGEKTNLRGILGAVIAVVGVTILFMK
ncbi:MAG TPA: EamA family transporter [Methanomicrobia archaeon]|nr:EamA family transporter [Methanomicrobia archaeon]